MNWILFSKKIPYLSFRSLADLSISVGGSILPYIKIIPRHTTSSKLLMYFLGFSPCFIILSISVEGLFFVLYTATLLGWAVLEKIIKYPQVFSKENREKEEENKLRRVQRSDGSRGGRGIGRERYVFDVRDVRLALVFFFFVHLGFFGIGK